eukprot:167793_1
MDADVSCVGLASVPQYGALPCHVPYNMPQMHPIPVFPFSTSQSGQRSFNPSLPPPNINRGTNDQYIACDTNGYAMWNEGAQGICCITSWLRMNILKQMRTQNSYTTALLPTMRMPCVTSTGGARMDADASCLGLTSVSPYNMRQMRPLPRLTFNAPLQSADTSSNPSLSPRNIDRGIGCDTNSHAMWNGNAHGTRISDSLMQMSNHTPSAHFATPSMQPMFHGQQGPHVHPMPMSFSKQNQSQPIAVKTEATSKNELYDDVPAFDTLAILDSFVCDSQWAMDHALSEETLFPFGTPDQDCMNNSMESGGFGGGIRDRKRRLSSPDSSLSSPSKKARL